MVEDNGKGRVKVRGRNGRERDMGEPEPIALSPLRYQAVVTAKRAILERLSLGGPPVLDVQVLEDGEHFVLWLADPAAES